MAGYKETPRQKMIGMLYLVLTALLALNVSKDILNAFVSVNEGMVHTNRTFAVKNNTLMAEFERQLAQQEERVRPFYEKALEARRLTEEMVQYIEDLNTDIIANTEFNLTLEPNNAHRSHERWQRAQEVDLADVGKLDNYHRPMIAMGVNRMEEIPNGRARQLKERIYQYREDMLNLLDEDQQIDLALDYPDAVNKHYGREMPWEFNTFYYTVLAAHPVIFNRMISDVLNAEADILTQLMNNISRFDFTFDAIEAAVVPQSRMIPQGSNFEATMFVAAFDTKAPIRATINGTEVEGDSGRIIWSQPAGAEGPQTVSGQIYVFDPIQQEERPYPFETQYTVFRPTATVAATNMNVFYRGLKNPVSVSVPGYSHRDVRVSISGGHTIRATGAGTYEVEPGSGREARVTVSVTDPATGQSRTMGTSDFRIRAVPTPVATFAGVTGGAIDKARIAANPRAAADMGDFVFQGVRFQVVSFNFVMAERSGVLTTLAQRGDRLDGAALARVQAATRGQRIFIENIMARGPDGQNRNLGSVILRIN